MKRPRILLVNPWIHDFAAYDLWARPMGLLVLGTRLRLAGWEPILVDCLDSSHPCMDPIKVKSQAHGRFARTPIPAPHVLSHVPRQYSRYGVHPELVRNDLLSLDRPEAILVTSMMTYWYPGVQEAVSLVREAFPGVPVLLGGIYASLLPDHAQEHVAADEVIAGPGESTLAEALFRHTGQARAQSSGAPALECAPALDLMREVRFVPLLTSRGCPLRCTYCASSRVVPRFIRRSVAEVIDEVSSARLHYGIQDIALYDDAFLVDAPRHALPILEAAGAVVPDMRWHTPNGLHAAEIDLQVARALKRAGFDTIRLGMESSSDSFHARTGKKVDFNRFAAAVRNLREVGFRTDQIGAYVLVGMPGQSRQQVEDDVEKCLQAGAYPKLAEYSPIPGTGMWPRAVESSVYPIEREPLFHNCSLLAAAEPGVDGQFLRDLRIRIREGVGRQNCL
jgi:radical SAM superfamily enzyme YgiQ (UPF0313 family)